MPQIVVEDLRKTFSIAHRTKGLWGAAAGLVHREYRDVHALEGISFSIEPGELVGYIGPNGAGKSTTVKILSGHPRAVRRAVRSVGPRAVENSAWNTSAGSALCSASAPQLWWDVPVIESFELLRDIYRVDKGNYRRTVDELIAMLDLTSLLDTPVRQLSLGQRMRCDLAAALVHAPQVLFLDEPTIGLETRSPNWRCAISSNA